MTQRIKNRLSKLEARLNDNTRKAIAITLADNPLLCEMGGAEFKRNENETLEQFQNRMHRLAVLGLHATIIFK